MSCTRCGGFVGRDYEWGKGARIYCFICGREIGWERLEVLRITREGTPPGKREGTPPGKNVWGRARK
jgi:hypothetical protein